MLQAFKAKLSELVVYCSIAIKLAELTGVHVGIQIESYDPRHLDAVICLSLRAWTPVFDSIQNAMNADVYQAFYPNVGAMHQS